MNGVIRRSKESILAEPENLDEFREAFEIFHTRIRHGPGAYDQDSRVSSKMSFMGVWGKYIKYKKQNEEGLNPEVERLYSDAIDFRKADDAYRLQMTG